MLCVVGVAAWPISWTVPSWLWQILALSTKINLGPKYGLTILTYVHFLNTRDY